MEIKESKQKYSSADTSINTINSIYKKTNFENGAIILDYGAGKYDSNKEYILNNIPDSVFLKYDKFNCSEEENERTIDFCKMKSPSWVICSNVLNVIEEDGIIMEIANNISELSDENTNIVFAIYEGNRSGIGMETPKGYQRNARAASYIDLLGDLFSVNRKGSFLFCKKKGELC